MKPYSSFSCCVHKYEDNPGSHTDAMGCFPDNSKMAETNQPVPLLIPEPEGEEF
jgi:hypothetical protein